MKPKTIITVSENVYIPVSIAQNGKNRFIVTYGQEVTKYDNWVKAFEQFGYKLAHSLECAGKLIR